MVVGTASGWTGTRLKNVATINGRSLGNETSPDYTFRYLEISNVNSRGIISEEAISEMTFGGSPSRARRVVQDRDTVISSVRPNLQAVAFIENGGRDLVASTGFYVVSPLRHNLYEKFAYYILLSDGSRQHFEAVAKGVGYPAVDDKDFGTLKFYLPPVAEQRRIVAYLDKACEAIDGAISAKRQQLEVLDNLRKSIIHKAVTHGLDEEVNLVESGLEWLMEVPQSWRRFRIKDIAQLSPGFSGAVPMPSDPCVVVPMEALSEKGDIDISLVQEFQDVQEGLTTFEKGDVLFAKITPCMENGKGALVGDLRTRYGFGSTEFHVLRPGRRVDGKFLYYFTINPVYRNYAAENMSGAAGQKRVSTRFLSYTSIFLPIIAEQCKIAAYLDKECKGLDDLHRTLEKQISALEKYRKSLIHECVAGKRRINKEGITVSSL